MDLIHILMSGFIVIMVISFTFIKTRVVFFVFLFVLMAFNDYVGGLQSSIIEFGGRLFYAADYFVILLICGLFRGCLKKDIRIKFDNPVFLIMVILAGYSIIGMLIGASQNYLYNDIIGDFRRYYYYPWAIFIPIILLRYRSDIDAIEKMVFVAASIICIFVFYRVTTGQTYSPEVHSNPYDQFRGMGIHDYFILIFAICIAMGKIVVHNRNDILLKAYLLLLPSFVIVSNFRFAWAFLVIGPFIMIILLRSNGISFKPLRNILLLSALMICLIGVSAKISGNKTYLALETRIVDKVLNYSFEESQRDYLWEEALSKWHVAPLIGIGLGCTITYVTKSLDGEWITVQAGNLHNSYIELVLKSGIIGLALFLLLQGILIIRCLKISHQAENHLPFVSASIVMIIAMLLQTGIQPFLTQPNSIVLLYLIIGSTLALPMIDSTATMRGSSIQELGNNQKVTAKRKRGIHIFYQRNYGPC